MLLGGIIHVLLQRSLGPSEGESDSAPGNERKYTRRQKMLVLLIAAFTVVDNVVSIVGITYVGGMLYCIVYGWVVVAAAVIRRFMLRRSLGFWQWTGVMAVSVGLSIAGLTGEQGPTQPAAQFLVGFLATIFAGSCDAFMYVCVEDVLSSTVGVAGVTMAITEAELMLMVGLVGSAVLAPVGWIYAVTGYWQHALYDPLKEHVGTECTRRWGVGAGEEPGTGAIVIDWISGGVCMAVHYVAFYAMVRGCNNSVVAGVAKSIQAIAVFFVNAALFGDCDTRQQITALKACSAALVISGSALYSLCKPSATTSCRDAPLAEVQEQAEIARSLR